MGVWRRRRARAMIERTISLTEQITDVLSLAMTYNWIAGYYLLDNQPETMHTYVRKAIVLAERYHFPLWLHGTHVWSGAALVRQGEVAQGTQLMEESLAALERWGMKRSRPRMLAYLAEGYGREGKLPQAREKLDEAFALATHTGEHCWNAELHRIQGEIYALAGQEREAERHFDQAVSTAMTQHAY